MATPPISHPFGNEKVVRGENDLVSDLGLSRPKKRDNHETRKQEYSQTVFQQPLHHREPQKDANEKGKFAQVNIGEGDSFDRNPGETNSLANHIESEVKPSAYEDAGLIHAAMPKYSGAQYSDAQYSGGAPMSTISKMSSTVKEQQHNARPGNPKQVPDDGTEVQVASRSPSVDSNLPIEDLKHQVIKSGMNTSEPNFEDEVLTATQQTQMPTTDAILRTQIERANQALPEGALHTKAISAHTKVISADQVDLPPISLVKETIHAQLHIKSLDNAKIQVEIHNNELKIQLPPLVEGESLLNANALSELRVALEQKYPHLHVNIAQAKESMEAAQLQGDANTQHKRERDGQRDDNSRQHRERETWEEWDEER